jgi:hypothetical protein
LDDAPNFATFLPCDMPPSGKHTITPIFEVEQRFKRGTLPLQTDSSKMALPVRIDFRIGAEQLEAIRQVIQAKGRRYEGPDAINISRQDAFVAFLAACISEADSEAPPVTVVSTVTSVGR